MEMMINGAAFATRKRLNVVNPATGVVFASAPDAVREDIDKAVLAARAAFPAWRDQPIEQRSAVVRAIADCLIENCEELAGLITQEQGRPLAFSMFEVQGCIGWLKGIATLAPPVIINEEDEERRSETRYLPVGVVAAITPWNFPLQMAIWKIAPALIAGCTIVLKPSPLTPLTTLRLGELVRDLMPPGVLNVVTGGDDVGPWLTSHPDVDKVSFTGSSATGRKVMASAAQTLKKVTLELGGNDPAIICDDVDVDMVAPQMFWAAFANTGQTCVAAKRVYVQDAIYDRFAEALTRYAASVLVGDGMTEGVQIGPIQNRPQYERVTALIEGARNSGLRFLYGGEKSDSAGYFVPITIIDNPPEDSPVVVEEAFGPVLPLMRFAMDAEVIERANATSYGLAASVWSADTDRAVSIAERLECGTVWINESLHMTPFTAFAGHKQSGLGVENGIPGLLEYMVPRTIIRRTSEKPGMLAMIAGLL